jgi:hypothetical protein
MIDQYQKSILNQMSAIPNYTELNKVFGAIFTLIVDLGFWCDGY